MTLTAQRGKRGHCGLARCFVGVRRRPVFVLAKGERPQPWRSDRRSGGLHDAANYLAGEHAS
jgi:hypothetical protein